MQMMQKWYYVNEISFAYRQRFKEDVVIDLVGYRRHGHQEVDEPRATQPKMIPLSKHIYVLTKFMVRS